MKQDQISHVVTQIIRMINSGNYLPGQRIKESDFSSALGLSRVPVREALRILAGDGVVELVPNKGAVLRVIPVEEIVDMLQVHDVLVRFAIERFYDNDKSDLALKKLAQQVEKIANYYESGKLKPMLRAIFQFHKIIIENADNSYLALITNRHYLGAYELHLRHLLDLKMLKENRLYFQKIYDALAAGDRKKACRLMSTKNRMMAELFSTHGV